MHDAFKVNNQDTKTTSIDVVLVSSLVNFKHIQRTDVVLIADSEH